MKYFRVNNRISVPKVRLIDENNVHLGTLETEKALKIAQDKGLDLIEISPKADPPIAKITDFGQFKYSLKKKEKEQKKQKKIGEVKGIRLTPRIGKHDLDFRVEKAKKFLSQNQKIKIEMILRGREKAHFSLARDLINQFISLLGEEVKIEQLPKKQGHRIIALLSPLKQVK
ncbi:translation initiation factor IF-3 [Patescibacteria group bacterium]|nr:translation initiation factor IF-3 [Patescibacteria group bacterium]